MKNQENLILRFFQLSFVNRVIRQLPVYHMDQIGSYCLYQLLNVQKKCFFVLFEIVFEILFDIVFEILCEIVFEILCEIVFEILCEIVLEIVFHILCEILFEILFEIFISRFI